MDDNMIAPRHDKKLDPITHTDAINDRAQNAMAYMLLTLSISPSDTVTMEAVRMQQQKNCLLEMLKRHGKIFSKLISQQQELNCMSWNGNSITVIYQMRI
jgi:hypothetical protein